MGGVLGDDMGLGKTVQVATLCKGLFDSEQIRKVLIVVPATMKSYWQTELQKWCSDVDNIMQFDDKRRADRELQIKSLKKRGGILVTSYGMVTSERMNLSDIRFDIVAVDEGHRAKNVNTDLRKNLVNLRVKGIRLSLSGTPIQNNLSELWSVFDFV
jgi:SNF2 family DNA or RNA helicase